MGKRHGTPTSGVVEVAVAAVWRLREGVPEVLLTRRPALAHLGGWWELPGGKIGAGETPAEAACRELREETAIHITSEDLTPLEIVEYGYPDRTVRIHGFLASLSPHREGPGPVPSADARWVPASELANCRLPPANDPLTRAIIARLSAI